VVTRPSIRNLSLAGLVVLGAGALAIMVWRLSDTLLLILAAVILGEGLRPAIQSLQRRGLPFGIATGLIYLALTIAIVLLLIAMARPLVSQSTQLAQTLPSYQRQIQGNVTLILARLQSINPKLYEAAAVSGAGTFRAFLDVTLPNLRTTLIVIALLRGIWMFNKFDSIWLVTHGGPLKATETLPLYAYRLAFEEFDFGLAAAACTVMFVVLLVGAVVYFKLFDPTKEIEVGR